MTTRTNLFTNPSAETNIDGWDPAASYLTRSDAAAHAGSWSLAVTPNNRFLGARPALEGFVPIPGPVTVTLSFWLRDADGPLQIRTRTARAESTLTDNITPPAPGEWGRIAHTVTVAAGDVLYAFAIEFTRQSEERPIYVDAVLLEAAAEAGEYFDGDTPDTAETRYVWTGEPHASTSIAEPVDTGPGPTVRQEVATALTAALPEDWRIINYADGLDRIDQVTLMVYRERVEPARVGIFGHIDSTITLWLLTKHAALPEADDALDPALDALIAALDALTWLTWSAAERGVYDDFAHGYKITATVTTTKE